jgi:hypothetical protein
MSDTVLDEATKLYKELLMLPVNDRDVRAAKTIRHLLGRLEAAEKTARGLQTMIERSRGEEPEAEDCELCHRGCQKGCKK